MKELMKELFPQLEGAIAKISKTNALYPLLIALLIAVAVVSIVFLSSNSLFLRAMSLVGVLVIIWEIVRSFSYFSKNNPDMLRSETHIIQKQALNLIGDENGVYGNNPENIIAIVNPDNKILPSDKIDPPPPTSQIEEYKENKKHG